MAEKPIPQKPGIVACEVCLKEIPESVAMNSEADDYTQHFCGIECYNKWRGSKAHQQDVPDEDSDQG